MSKFNFSRKYILEILKLYDKHNPHEKIMEHVGIKNLRKSKQSFISRKNFYGHITASAILLDCSLSKILLVYHNNIKKYLQPGGHIDENDETLWKSAYRELKEETGISNASFIPFDNKNKNIPFDIDIHKIPENPLKKEPEHIHIDFRYLFILDKEKNLKIKKDEVSEVIWKPIDEYFLMDSEKKRVAQKIKKIISEKRDELFFDKIAHEFSIDLKNFNIVAVLHIVPDIISFIDILQKLAKNVIVIPKQNSLSKETLSKISQKLIYFTNRDELKNINILNKIFKKEEKYIIIDTGGYFATLEFNKFIKKRKNIIGIVEDTENGYQKYEKLKNNISFPIISIARSELKNNEDDLVGYSIGFYTEWIIRKLRKMPRYMKCSIIGYGRLGKGIAKYLFNQNIKPLIYDKDPIKLIESFKDGCIPATKEEILKNSELIFCATGNGSLNINDFLKIYPGCYIASVTSSDDEFDLNDINNYFQKKIENKFITKYENENTYFYLINDGNTVNFIDKEGDRASDFIRIVQAEILCALKKLIKEKIKPGIYETTKEEKRKIASIFLNYYHNFNFQENN